MECVQKARQAGSCRRVASGSRRSAGRGRALRALATKCSPGRVGVMKPIRILLPTVLSILVLVAVAVASAGAAANPCWARSPSRRPTAKGSDRGTEHDLQRRRPKRPGHQDPLERLGQSDRDRLRPQPDLQAERRLLPQAGEDRSSAPPASAVRQAEGLHEARSAAAEAPGREARQVVLLVRAKTICKPPY